MIVKLTEPEFKRIIDYVQKNYGINLAQKRVLLEGRLSNMIGERGFKSFTEYLDYIFADKSGQEIVNFVNKVTTNHTFFWREPRHWEFMMQQVLPWIDSAVRDRDIRIWCAASSSGEEPYNICMCLDSFFGARAHDWDLRILATDIDTDILKKASKAEYDYESVKTLPRDWIAKYFTKTPEGKYRVIDRIRKMVVFKKFNLMDNISYKKPYHLISCRNVMIYFDQDTKNALIERFYDVTAPDGFLFIGHAETVAKTSRFSYVEPAIYRKKPR
jgi:chemotaxis protein methyltransferase CheR